MCLSQKKISDNQAYGRNTRTCTHTGYMAMHLPTESHAWSLVSMDNIGKQPYLAASHLDWFYNVDGAKVCPLATG